LRRWLLEVISTNVGLPHTQVKEEMDRFMHEVAPAFEGAQAPRDLPPEAYPV
jgi:hypothetical protein